MKILLLNQCFYPDVVSSAQHLSDLAVALAARGHQVTVIASQRGYDDPHNRFPRVETWKGVRIVRLPSLNLGKNNRWRRALNFGSFFLMCSLRLIWSARFDAIVALTSPPLISLLGAILARIQHARFIFWVMDLNPDEAIAAGWLNERSVAAAFLRNCLHYSLRQAAGIVVLDRFMRQRILDKGIANETVTILPPWAHDDQVKFDPQGREAFRLKYELTDKFVVMYSGNHSPCHPLATLLEAARQLADHPNLIFCFVGGGTEHKRVEAFAKAHRLQNIRCLPYQPLSSLSASLSAADLHVVVMGDSFTGIVHPCKIYNLLAIKGPLLYIGPTPSHVTDIFLAAKELRFHSASHNDVSKVVQSVLAAERNKPPERSFPAGLAKRFSKSVLLPELVRIIEEAGRVGVENAVESVADNDPQAAPHYALQISDT